MFRDKKQWQCIGFGLAAYAENYQGIGAYVASRLKYLSPIQKDVIASFALAYYYGQQSLSLYFFAKLLQRNEGNLIEIENIFNGDSAGAIDLLILEDSGSEYRVMHQLIAKEILVQTLSTNAQITHEESKEKDSEDTNDKWKLGLSDFGRTFAEILAKNNLSLRSKDILHKLFIDRGGKRELATEKPRYAKLIEDIPSEHGRLELFHALSELFPYEAHIHAHMARLNSHAGDFDTAKSAIHKALELAADDDVIHHISGTILHREIRNHLKKSTIDWGDVEHLAREALDCYQQSRSLDDNKEHGYISAIELCVLIIESAKKKLGNSLHELLQNKKHGLFYFYLLNEANELLEAVHELHKGSSISGNVVVCEGKLQAIHDNYAKALECYNNLLSRPDAPKYSLRRLIARTYGLRNSQISNAFDSDTAEKVYYMMESNIRDEKNYSKNMSLWLKATRGLRNPPTLNKIVEKISYWKAESRDINALFYLATLLSIQAIEGVSGALRQAEIALEECKDAARYNSRRTMSREWLADTTGIKALIPHAAMGEWDEQRAFFTSNLELKVLEGRIFRIIDNGKGIVTLACGLNAFFIPSRFAVIQGKDENTTIKFHLAFSYDGLIAWHPPNKEDIGTE